MKAGRFRHGIASQASDVDRCLQVELLDGAEGPKWWGITRQPNGRAGA